MMCHVHALTRRRIRSLFLGRSPPSRLRALWAELSRCAACAELYARYHRLESALAGSRSAATPMSLERVEASLFATPEASARPKRRETPAWAWGVAIAGALVLLFFLADHLGSRRPMEAAALAARGQTQGAASEVGIRLLRIGVDGGAEEVRSAVARDEVVTFTATHIRPELRYLALFGVQRDGIVHWFYPGTERGESVVLPPPGVDTPLVDGFRLSGYTEGWLRVTALFSTAPLSTEAVERAVEQLQGREGALESLEPLALEVAGVGEHSLRVEIGVER